MDTAICTAIYAAIDTALHAVFYAAVWPAIYTAIDTAICTAIYSAIDTDLFAAIYAAVCAAIYAAIYDLRQRAMLSVCQEALSPACRAQNSRYLRHDETDQCALRRKPVVRFWDTPGIKVAAMGVTFIGLAFIIAQEPEAALTLLLMFP